MTDKAIWRQPFVSVVLAALLLLGAAGEPSSVRDVQADESLQSAVWPDFQAAGQGQGVMDNRAAGLGFHVALDGWPRLTKNAGIYDSLIPPTYWAPPPKPALDFGLISTPEAPPTSYTLFENQWTHVGVAFTPALRLYISRLSPAIVVEATASSLTFFGDAAQPAYFATPGGVVSRERLSSLPTSSLGQSWLLVWFSRGAGFEATNFPWQAQEGFPSPVYAVDVPLLFIFQHAPVSLHAQPGADLVINFSGQAGRIAVLPLLGDRYLPVRDTENWSLFGVPASIKTQADWWATHLGETPIAATETCAYTETVDTVTCTVSVRFLPLRSAGVRFAPLPPMLALAKEHGFPIQLSGVAIHSQLLTALGPYRGIEDVNQYTYAIRGLEKYVKEVRQVSRPSGEPNWLSQILHQETHKTIAAGHLAPWYPATNGYVFYPMHRGFLTWSATGENLYLLSQTMPLLDSGTRADLQDYVRAEKAQFPPDTVPFLKADQGARRERWRIDPEEITRIVARHNEWQRTLNYYNVTNLIPAETLYYLAEYGRRMDDDTIAHAWTNLRSILYPYLFRQDWATLGWYEWPISPLLKPPSAGYTLARDRTAEINGLGGVVDANHYFAAIIGALRLADWANDTTGLPILWGQLARVAILRYGMERYGDYLYSNQLVVLPTATNWLHTYGRLMYQRRGHTVENFERQAEYIAGQPDWMVRYLERSWVGSLYTYVWTGPQHDVRSLVALSQFGVRFDDKLHPSFGKGLVPYRGLVPELGRFLADQAPGVAWARAFVERVAENAPDWYHALGRQALGLENNYMYPEDSYQVFLARAWILQEAPDTLARYLDVPWMERGDLYFSHKVAETINAYRGITWSVAAPHPTARPTPGLSTLVPTGTAIRTPTPLPTFMPPRTPTASVTPGSAMTPCPEIICKSNLPLIGKNTNSTP